MEEKYAIHVLQKTADLIEAMLQYPNGATLKELYEITKINKATIFRILMNMRECGYAIQNSGDGKYRLGYRFVEVSNSILSRLDIRHLVHPYLERLSAKISEVVHLIVLDGDEGLYVDKVENFTSAFKMYSQVGRHLMLHCTSAGKVLLSGMSSSEIDRIIQAKGLPRKTNHTITQPNELKMELAKIRKQGYGVDEIENEEGIRCIAAPIYDYKKRIIAVVSIAGTTLSVTEERIPELAAQLKEATAQISREIGGDSPKIS